MILTGFAPNETVRDAWVAILLFLQPWNWIEGKSISKLRIRLKKRFFSESSTIHFTLTARAALYNFLRAHNLPENSQVLVQGFTCAAVILPITAQNLIPVYVDINDDDFSMNLEDLKKKYTPQAKVLILQHTFGITPKNRNKIIQFAKDKKLVLLEDLAHGFDPELFRDKPQYGSLLLSFGRSKALSSVFGGAIVSKYKKIDEYFTAQEKQYRKPSYLFIIKLILYKTFAGLIKATYGIVLGRMLHIAFTSTNLFEAELTKKEKSGHYDIHLAKSFPNICAQFVLNQLNIYNDVMKTRKTISLLYSNELNQNPDYRRATLRFPYLTENRNNILKKMSMKGIILGTWYDQIIAPNSINLRNLLYKNGTCPTAESLCAQIVNLPTFVTIQQAKRIIQTIKSI